MVKIFNQKNFNNFVWSPLGSRGNIYINFCLQVHFHVSAVWYCSHYLPPVSTTQGELVAKFAAGVVDTGFMIFFPAQAIFNYLSPLPTHHPDSRNNWSLKRLSYQKTRGAISRLHEAPQAGCACKNSAATAGGQLMLIEGCDFIERKDSSGSEFEYADF